MAAADMDDDDSWLYGDAEKKDGSSKVEIKKEKDDDTVKSKESDGKAPSAHPAEKSSEDGGGAGDKANENGDKEDREDGEMSGDDDDNKENEDSDDDSDDDDVQVTIGDIKTQPTYDRRHKGYSAGAGPGKPTKGVDVDAVGEINGVPTYEFDINGLQPEERPWHKPGADITDYFNYGFTEETWIKYCMKQRQMRNAAGDRTYIPHTPLPSRPSMDPSIDSHKKQQSSKTTPSPVPIPSERAGPPPFRKSAGFIDVIGSTQRDSRRPAQEFDNFDGPGPDFSQPVSSQPAAVPPVGSAISTISPVTSMAPPPNSFATPPNSMPPMPMGPPPTGMPPLSMGPPPMSVPPPGIPPPHGVPPPHGGPMPPHGGAPGFDPFFPPPGGPPPDRGPPPGFDNRNPFGFDPNAFGGPPPGFGGPPNSGPPGWDNRSAPGTMPSPMSDSELSSSDDERERRAGRYPGRDMYDPFDRDRGYRDSRDRDRDRYRDRERDRRDRERIDRERERERDDRHSRSSSSKRERKHDEVDSHRSKHKKSKRSKRDRDDESGDDDTPKSEEAAP